MRNTVCNTVCCLGTGVIRTTQTSPHVKRILIKGDKFQNNSTADDFFRNKEVLHVIRSRGGGTAIHYLYGYVPPNGVVILKLLI